MKDCDCSADCGDDPWLRDGRARPCIGRIMSDHTEALRINTVMDQKRKAELYDYMLEVAKANGFNSLTEAIAAQPRGEVVFTIHGPARRYTDNGRRMIGIWEVGVRATLESTADDRCPLEIGANYKITVEKL